MGALKPWHIFVLVAVLVLLFGAKRLPDAARGLGRSMRILKAETKGLIEGDDEPKQAPSELETRQAELDRKQAELDAERERLKHES